MNQDQSNKFFRISNLLLIPACAVLLACSGCIELGHNSPVVENYTLEYAPPTFEKLPALDQSLKIERFNVSKAYNSLSIFFRPEPYKLDSYANSNWVVNPGYLLCDLLVRDFRNSGLFNGVFTYRDFNMTRYVIEGTIEEFLEVDEGSRHKATLAMSMALFEQGGIGMPKRPIYQKYYRSEAAVQGPTVDSLVKGMSEAMKDNSRRIIRDAYDAIRRESAGPEHPK